MTELIKFLLEEEPDTHGRILSNILAFTDIELEEDHNFIQWLFPLETMSQSSWESPILTVEEIRIIRESRVIQQNIKQALERMTSFYLNNDYWLSFHNHNHLRITRILIATRSLLGQSEAEKFFDTIMERISGAEVIVSSENIAYWNEAIGR